jgi:3D-(3,5/4)-trihydroxycyclohexane-1,2-dione acylhydrolase (decyclizing)
MGYEIAGGLGAKMAAPDREVYVMVGDGSYLMMSQEIVTAVQEGLKLIIVLIDNHGFASIGGLSQSLGSDGFGTHYRARGSSGQLDGPPLPIDFAQNARSLGAHVIVAPDLPSLRLALAEARRQTRTTVIVTETDREQRVGGYESWWDVPVAEVSSMPAVQDAYAAYAESRQRERHHL